MDVEQSLVNHLHKEESLKKILSIGLNNSLIYTPKKRAVFDFAVNYFKRYKLAPTTEVLSTEFVDLEVNEPEEALELIVERLTKRFIKNQLESKLEDACRKGAEDPVEAIRQLNEETAALVRKISSKSTMQDIKATSDERLDAYIERSINQGVKGAIFGWKEFDEHTYGIRPGEMAILAARPKTGKTYAALQAGVASAKAGMKVFISSLEVDKEQMGQRVDCLLSGVSPRKYQRGELMPDEIEQVKKALKEFNKCDGEIIIDCPPTGERSASDIVQKARNINADVLIVDQLSFVEFRGKYDKSYEKIGYILETFKNEINVEPTLSLILVNQINRQAVEKGREDKMADLNHLAMSGNIEAFADWVFCLLQTKEMRNNRILHFGIIGARREDLGIFSCEWNLTTSCRLQANGRVLD